MLVNYCLQPEKTPEYNAFRVTSANQELTVGDIKQQFPLKGSFYMRFKTILQEENPPIAVWLDGLDDFAPVPTFKDSIYLKVLPVPPFRHPPAPRKLYKKLKSSNTAHEVQKPELKQGEFIDHSQNKHNERSHSANPLAEFPKVIEPKKSFDPMADFFSEQPKFFSRPGEAKPFTDPTNGLTTEQLKKREQDRINQEVNKKTEEVQNIWKNEESLRSEKLDAEKEFNEKLTNWEVRNHQKNNIRALLATMHNVLWKDSGWEPIGPGDLITSAQVKAAYLKSLNVIHPDKHQNDSPAVRYISERVFGAVNAAFKVFRTNPQ